MSPLRGVLTGAWGKAYKLNSAQGRLMIFGGAPNDVFVYIQVDGKTVFKFALGGGSSTLSDPMIWVVKSFGCGSTPNNEEKRLLVSWWEAGLKKYLLSVKNVGNSEYLPEIAKNYLLKLL